MIELWMRVAVGLSLLGLSTGIPSYSSIPETSSDDHSREEFTRTFGHAFGKSKKPHIIVMLADDLGWNDVSFHGSNQIPTPNIDAIGYNGIILNSHYVSPMCTPSRSALMTGKYPIHTGMQHSVIIETEPRGLPLEEKLLPEYLREAGYKTHAIGKWHLGFFKHEYTPTYRGFDSHFGYWHGFQDYWSHDVVSTKEQFRGFDMRSNMSVAWDTKGKYSTDLFTEEAVRLINEHDTREPMFMYMAHLAPHAGLPSDPYQAPDDEIAKFSYIEDPERRTYAAMVSKLDSSVGDVVTALRRRGMLDNSIILFMSDNGAPTMGIHNNRGSNYPLRGIKDSAWEGAVRGVAAMWSPLIKKPRRVSNQLISIVDWLPTFWSAAGMNIKDLGKIDGINVWNSLTTDRKSPRNEILINIDAIENYSALRRGDFKYVYGHTTTGDSWYGANGLSEQNDTEIHENEVYPRRILKSKVGAAISGVVTAKQVANLRRRREAKFLTINDDETTNTRMLTEREILKLRDDAVIRCNVRSEQRIICNPVESPCLFNIKDDPCEEINLAEKRPNVLETLESVLLKFRATVVPESNIPGDPLADPSLWNGVWVNWRDPRPMAFSLGITKFSTASVSGPTIAVIAVIVGLIVVGTMTLVALRSKKNSSSLSQPKNGEFSMSNGKTVEIDDVDVNDRRSRKNETNDSRIDFARTKD